MLSTTRWGEVNTMFCIFRLRVGQGCCWRPKAFLSSIVLERPRRGPTGDLDGHFPNPASLFLGHPGPASRLSPTTGAPNFWCSFLNCKKTRMPHFSHVSVLCIRLLCIPTSGRQSARCRLPKSAYTVLVSIDRLTSFRLAGWHLSIHKVYTRDGRQIDLARATFAFLLLGMREQATSHPSAIRTLPHAMLIIRKSLPNGSIIRRQLQAPPQRRNFGSRGGSWKA